ncbi:mucin-5AC-like [Ruditapes philippinarum]|uniref:mucin-5AC-like n=1 Tax=Ruditapes philippinarum TaxID=129788 RepID=UPI00295BE9B8|nr:mucin-5AC-like [Ruditapes philippinarum]
MSKDRTTTMQLITTTQVEETKPPIETIQTTKIVKPSIITEKEGLLEITTQEDIRTSEKIIDVHTQKQTPGTIETTSRTTSDEIITTLKPTAEVKDETKAVDNITVTTETPKVTTNIFDIIYYLNETYETTESGTTEVTELPTNASEVTYTQTILKAVTTTPKEDANQTSTTSPSTESVSKESSTVSEILPVETTIEKEISFTTQTDKTTSIEVTTLQSAQKVTDEIIQVTSDITTDKPKETITGSKAEEIFIETTTVHVDSISSRITEPANITITESPLTVDHNVSTSTTAKMQESTIQIKTEIATEFSNATLPSSVTTSQETEITTSSEIVDETKQPTVTTIPADDVTSTVIPEDTGFVTTQQSSEALKILVNETIGEQGITEPAPILNVSSISDILTTRAIATESEPSSTTSITLIETTKVEVVKDSVTERYNKTVGPDSTLDKKDMQTSPETIHAQLTTVAAPVTNATTIMDTAKLEEVNETSSKGLELTTDATESSDVVEHITKSLTGVSEIVPLSTTDTYGYNTSDVYYDYETTTSSEVSVEPSTELPVELVSTQATKVSVVQESSTQGVTEQTAREVTTPISKTSSAETVGTTTSKSEITQEKTQIPTSTEGIKVTTPPTTQIAQSDTSVVSEVEITTQQQSVTSLLPNVTTRTPDEVTITFSIVASYKSTDEINATTQSTDASTLHIQIATTKDAQSVEKTTEIPVTVKTSSKIPATEQVEAVTSSIGNDTAPADVTTQVVHTESLAIEKISKPVSEVSPTVTVTTGNGSATDDVISTTISTASVINETESFSSVPSSNETTSPSTTEVVPSHTSAETVPDLIEPAQTTTERQADSPSRLINTTDTSLLTTKQVFNDSTASVLDMESTTISDSVQETSPADMISETFATETPVNVTDTIYADNMTTVNMQDTSETRNATDIFNTTTTTATTTTTTTTTAKTS